MNRHFLIFNWTLGLLAGSLSAADPDGTLYIMNDQRESPTIAMYKTERDGRLVTSADVKRLTKITLRWNEKEAAELVRTRRFVNVREVSVGDCNLRFQSLQHLRGLPLTGLFPADRCEARPDQLHVLALFPDLEKLDIDFGFNGVAANMKSLEIEPLEVLRKLPKLREVRAAGWGLTSIATPRFSNHPNLEKLHFGVCSVGVKGEIKLTGLPKLKSLRLPDLESRHINAVLRIPSLESLSADAENLSFDAFLRLRQLSNLKQLELRGFWTPEKQIDFLQGASEYSEAEIQVVMAIQALRLLAKEEADLREMRPWANAYAAILMGTQAEPLRRDKNGRAITFVEQAFRENNTIKSLQRSIAQEAIRVASTSKRDGFYERASGAIERYSGLKFAKQSMASAQQPKTKPKRLTNSLGMDFRGIPVGSFVHTDEQGKQSTARITQPYYMGVYEVTQSQFEQVMGFNPSGLGARNTYDKTVELPIRGENLPVNNITAYEGIQFCWKLSQLDAEKKAQRRYRLPTEQEWEFACRAGTTTRFHFGDTGDYKSTLANFAPRRFRYEVPTTRPQLVGSYPANAFGLHDMHGNVCEPCMDARGKWDVSTPDFVRLGKDSGNNVFRGADYLTMAGQTGSSHRHKFYEGLPFAQIGLRVVCVVEPASPLSKRVLKAQFNLCDPGAKEIRYARAAVERATKRIVRGTADGYLDRVEAFTRLGKVGPNPEESFALAKKDLLSFQKQMSARYERISYFEAARDWAAAAGDRFLSLGKDAQARQYWENAVKLGDLLVAERLKTATELTEADQQRAHRRMACYAVQQLTHILVKLDRSDEAIRRLNKEAETHPTLMAIYRRRAEIKQEGGDIAGAIDDLRRALHANPERFDDAKADYASRRKTYGFEYFEKIMHQLADAFEQHGEKEKAAKQRRAVPKMLSGQLLVVE